MDRMEFYFGKFYSPEMINDDIYKDRTSYEINMNTMLKELFSNEDSLKIYWNTFFKNILYLELAKQKDLMNFTSEEIKELFMSVPTASSNTKNRLYSLVQNYLLYSMDKGYININVLGSLDKQELLKVNKKASVSKYISVRELSDVCEKMYSGGHCSAQDIFMLIAARFGIMGKGLEYLRKFRSEQLDRENKLVYLNNESIVPVSEKFIYWMDKAENEKEFNGKIYYNEGYVIKRYDNVSVEEDGSVTEDYVYNRILAFFKKSPIRRISFKVLETCCKIDYLLDIRKNRYLNTSDLQAITRIFNPDASVGTYNSLKTIYEAMTGDKVLLQKERYSFKDENPEESIKVIKERLGYEG